MKKPQLWILICVVSVATINGVLYTPALPQIADYFHLSKAQAQWTMTLFLIGYGLGPFFYGPLSNRYGRRPVLVGGLVLSVIAALLGAASGSVGGYWLLCASRFIMALASSVGLAVSFMMVGDVYNQTQARRIISYMTLSFAAAPGVANAIGGVLTEYFNWQSCFYFSALYGIVLLVCVLPLPETLPQRDEKALHPVVIAKRYVSKLRDSHLLTCTMLSGMGTAMLYLFASDAPFIGIRVLGLSPEEYGALSLVPPLGMVVGSLLSARLSARVEPMRLIRWGIASSLLGALCAVVAFALGWVSVTTLFVPAMVTFFGVPLVMANVSGISMTRSDDKAHTSAVLNGLNLEICALSVWFLQVIPTKSVLVLPSLMLAAGIVQLFFRRILSRCKD